MKKLVQRAGVVTLLAMALSVQVAAAAIGCADYITTADGDSPNYGWLTGEKTVTTTRTMSWAYTNFGGTFNGSSTQTESYSVGTYQMADGRTYQVRCDVYQRV